MTTNPSSQMLATAHQLEDALELLKHQRFSDQTGGSLKRAEIFTLHLIDALKSDQPVTTSMIANKLGVTLAAITHHLNILEAEGYIARIASTDDRRIFNLKLTQKSRQVLRQFKQRRRDKIVRLVEFLGPKDSTVLLGLLTKITQYFNQIQMENHD